MFASQTDRIRKMLFGILLGGILLALCLPGAGSPAAHAQGSEFSGGRYTTIPLSLSDGTLLKRQIINGPPVPPPGYEAERKAVPLPFSDGSAANVIGPGGNGGPVYVLSCAATAAGDIAGMLDRTGYSNIYPHGDMPPTNDSFGTFTDVSGTTYSNNPLVASHIGVNGRTIKGTIDDYWISYGCAAPDPFSTGSYGGCATGIPGRSGSLYTSDAGGWPEHAWGDAIGDYMYSSQSAHGNNDGDTSFYTYQNYADPLTCDVMAANSLPDGTLGMKNFFNARGYAVNTCYNQPTDNVMAGGFSFAQFKTEIDTGHPVMLNLEGHTVVGVGYESSSNLVYIHDGWDYNTHTMTWGGSYAGMPLQFVSIIHLAPVSHVISGNVGIPGVTLSYVDGTTRSVVSQANGNYSFQVSNGWSGTVTPSLACYTFEPGSLSFSDTYADQTGQNFKAVFTPGSGCTNMDVSIGGLVQGSYYVQPHEVLVKSYAGLQNGPVKVKSSDSSTLFSSERVISGSSFNEVMGYPKDQLTTEYWFPWYDNKDMATWILVGNASSTQEAAVDIYIGGVKKGSYTIPIGGQVRPRFGTLQTGPVRVVSTNGAKIFTSERTLYGSNSAFNEVMGYPASQFTTEYWFPWYDNKDMATWILVGNPTSSTAKVTIYVGTAKASFTIGAGKQITPRFGTLQTGPVRVVSTNGVKIFSSERTLYGDSFNEVMGSPANQFTTEYFYPWYDNVSMATWVLVGNPTPTAASVDIYIGGIKQTPVPISVKPGQQINQRYNLNTGPVRVVCTNCTGTNGIKIFSSERVLYSTSFNEVMGYPGNQLTTEYWFTWFDSTSMSTNILVGRP